MGKKRIIKKFELLPPELVEMVEQEYPDGYEDNLITFQTATGELATGIPLDTEEVYYLIKMPKTPVASEDDEFEGSQASESEKFESLDSLQIADDVADEDD